MRKLRQVWEFVKIWNRKPRPIINKISKQAQEQEIQEIADTYGVLAARRARAITLSKKHRDD
jgi:hypothetical protein